MIWVDETRLSRYCSCQSEKAFMPHIHLTGMRILFSPPKNAMRDEPWHGGRVSLGNKVTEKKFNKNKGLKSCPWHRLCFTPDP
jgi:hypothetical protein